MTEDSHTSNNGSHTNVRALTRESNSSHGSHTDPPDLLGGVRNGQFLNETVFEPLTYCVPKILPEGFAVIAGPPKAGKSWVVLDWLLSVAAGGRALGTVATGKPRRVLYLALEDSDRRMQERCFAVMQQGAVPDLFHYKTRLAPNMLQATVEAFLEQYPDTALVVVDTLGKVMPPMMSGETTYQRDYRVGSWLWRMAHDHKGLCVLVVHHTRKGISSDFVDSVSGTNGLAGAADTILVLTRDRNSNEGTLQVTGRDIEEAEYGLTSDGGRWRLDGDDLESAAETAYERKDVDHLGGKSKAIMQFVGDHPEGIAAKDVAVKFGAAAHEYLRRLCESGHIEKPARGIYTIATPKGRAA